jgi:undecaprenyl-phosphate 4-deoxy-4-formamido-L-arabinose transferase
LTSSCAGEVGPFLQSLSVVIPVYNGSGSLSALMQRLGAVLPSLSPVHEVILVNDGSLDDSWTVIERLCAEHSWVRGIDLARNYGQHNALLCGIRDARGDILITMDDDLQHPPEELPRLIHRLDEGVDLVYGTPRDERHDLWRAAASLISKIVLQQAMGAEGARSISAFRVFRRAAAGAFEAYGNSYVNVDVLLSWGARRFTAVPVQHDARHVGSSNYTFRKLVRHAVTMMTGYSLLPLRVASLTGFVLMLFGLGVLAFVLGRYLYEGDSVPGFPFLASLIAIFGGAQLFSLGVIGEYLGRIYFRSLDRPAFLVRARVGTAS